MKKTFKQYELYLNAFHSEHYDFETMKDNFIYLTNKTRGKHISEKTLIKAYYNKTLGSLLRKYDPIAFRVGFNEWQPGGNN